MIWIFLFAFIGVIAGAILGAFGNAPGAGGFWGIIFGTGFGFYVKALNEERKQKAKQESESRGARVKQSPLALRVELLEREVKALRAEISELRLQGVATAKPVATSQEERPVESVSPAVDVQVPLVRATQAEVSEPIIDVPLSLAETEKDVGAVAEPELEPAVPSQVAEEISLELSLAPIPDIGRDKVTTPGSIEENLLKLSDAPDAEHEAVSAVEPEKVAAAEMAEAALPAAASLSFTPKAVPAAPPAPTEPREPNMVESLIKAGRDWLLGGNTIVRVGIIVLFFGVAFLLKYAADNSMLPMEFRLAGVALGATALLATGWRLGRHRKAYGLILEGGGVGILYLNVFAATKLYHLLPNALALAFMIMVCLLSAYLAVRQNALSLAFMGSTGGFLAPVLMATGGGSHVALFSYYALLNLGIFTIAWFKAWRPLNLLGFVFTFGIGTAWGATSYRPELLASTEPFLILFFLMYVGIALLYAVRREIALKHYVDGTLVFGTPLIVIGLQAALMRDIEFGLSWSAVALAAFYIGVTTWLKPRRDRLGLLFESTLALSVIFATLAVPLAFTGETTSAVWAVEGAAIVWVCLRQRRMLGLVFGLLLQLAAGIAFGVGYSSIPSVDVHVHPILNSGYIGALMVALAGLFTGWRLHGRGDSFEWHSSLPDAGIVAAIWGLAWWVGGGLHEIDVIAAHFAVARVDVFNMQAVTGFAVITAWLAHGVRRRLSWALAEFPALALVPVVVLMVLSACAYGPIAVMGAACAVWFLAMLASYVLLWRQQRDVSEFTLSCFHVPLFWSLCLLLARMGYWYLLLYVPEGAWSWSAWAYGFGVLLILLVVVGRRIPWPIQRFSHAYLLVAAAPIALGLWGWSLLSVLSDGDASPLFYIPVFNPLDVAQAIVAMALMLWLRQLTAMGRKWRGLVVDFAVLISVFLWFSAEVLRSVHAYHHLPYTLDTITDSFGVQQIYVVAWCAFILLGMWRLRNEQRVHLFTKSAAPLLAAMCLWAFVTDLVQDGGEWAKIPLLNPLDLIQILVYGVTALWLRRAGHVGIKWSARAVEGTALVIVFVWFNATLLRTLHHHMAVDFNIVAVLDSFNLQEVFIVAWSVFAFTGLWFVRREGLMRLFSMASAPLLAVMWLWTFVANFTQDGGHWAQLPLLNPLDMIQIIVYGITLFWLVRLSKLGFPVANYRTVLRTAAAVTGFIWLNAVLMRTLHHWAHIPYDADSLARSTLVQASVSVFWTICALTTMVLATRKVSRRWWFTGGALLGLTVVKLFLFDLSHIAGLQRIVSFLGIGILLLLIGYFSPLPPKAKESVE